MTELLLHVCCAPCSLLSWKVFEKHYQVTGLFFNPNIHPYKEFNKRKETLRQVSQRENRKILFEEQYLLKPFLQGVAGKEDNRCRFCYEMRLGHTARKAKELGFEHFSTTLIVSTYQDHDLIQQTGESIGENLGLRFVYKDLRIMFKDSIALARKQDIYTQGYCGCIYSEKERYDRQ